MNEHHQIADRRGGGTHVLRKIDLCSIRAVSDGRSTSTLALQGQFPSPRTATVGVRGG